MADNIDLRSVQDQKLQELYNYNLAEDPKGFRDAAEGVATLFKTESEIGKDVDDYVLKKQELDLERERFELEKEQQKSNKKTENVTLTLKIVGAAILVGSTLFDGFCKLVVLGTDECSPRAMSRTCRDVLESKFNKKPDIKL